MSILVSFGEFFGDFFPLSHPCVCDTLLDIFLKFLIRIDILMYLLW